MALEFVIAYMSPSKFRLGFHFSRYDDFILPPIIRREIRGAALENKGHYTVYLPSYHPEEIVSFVNQSKVIGSTFLPVFKNPIKQEMPAFRP